MGRIRKDPSYYFRDEEKAEVLNPVYQRIGRAQILLRNDFRDRRPHCGRDQGVARAEEGDAHISIKRHPLRREGNDKVAEKYAGGSGNHPVAGLAEPVHEGSEKRGEDYGEERNHCHHGAGRARFYAETRNDDGRAEFLEGTHAAVESDTEQAYGQEAGIPQDLEYVFETELVLILHLSPAGDYAAAPVEAGVEPDEQGPYRNAAQEQHHSHESGTGRVGKTVPVLRDTNYERGRYQGYARAETGYGKLQAHSQGHISVFEPFGNGTGNGHPGDFAAQPEAHPAYPAEGYGRPRREAGGEGVPGEAGAADHHGDEHRSHHAHSEYVQKHAAYDQASADAEQTVVSEKVTQHSRVPPELQRLGMPEQMGNGAEHIVEEIRREHRDHQAGQGRPAED